jgi:hypothetical protein
MEIPIEYINLMHIFIISPLLYYIGNNKQNSNDKSFNILAILALLVITTQIEFPPNFGQNLGHFGTFQKYFVQLVQETENSNNSIQENVLFVTAQSWDKWTTKNKVSTKNFQNQKKDFLGFLP